MIGKPICRELIKAIAQDKLDDSAKAALERHVEGCATCRPVARARAAMRDAVLAEDDRLDDLTRTRVLARLGKTIDEVTFGNISRVGRVRRGLAWSLGLAAAAAVVLGLGLYLAQRPVTNPAKEVSSAKPSPLLTPYDVQVADEPARPVLGKALDRLQLPARATVRAHLAELAELTLVGPLDLSVASASQEVVELQLGRGILVGDYDGTRGGKLRVHSGATTVEVVGTLFGVEANHGDTRVSVVHGKVRVECQGEVVMLTNGQSWSASRKKVEPFTQSVSLLFEQAAHGFVDEAVPAQRESATPRPTPSTARSVETSVRVPTSSRTRPALAMNLPRHASEESAGPAVALPAPEVPPASPSTAGSASAAISTSMVWPPPSAEPESAPTWHPADAPTSALGPTSMPVPPAVPNPPPVTAASLYRQAETALQHGDGARGQQLLSDLIARFPMDPSTDAARFELTLIFQKAGQRQQALALADELARSPREGPFMEPARFLRCRLVADASAATACLQGFVAEYPRSSHHAQALQMLIELHLGAGHCAKAAELAKSYLAAHPRGAFTAQAERVRADCAK